MRATNKLIQKITRFYYFIFNKENTKVILFEDKSYFIWRKKLFYLKKKFQISTITTQKNTPSLGSLNLPPLLKVIYQSNKEPYLVSLGPDRPPPLSEVRSRLHLQPVRGVLLFLQTQQLTTLGHTFLPRMSVHPITIKKKLKWNWHSLPGQP